VWDAESGELHRELEGFEGSNATTMETFPSADGQQLRLAVGSSGGDVRVYDPEAGSVLHRLHGHHICMVRCLACIASASAAPHHPRIVSASADGTTMVYDGETGALLADLRERGKAAVWSVVVWKEHVGGHDRIATTGDSRTVEVWDGEAFSLLHELRCGDLGRRLLSFQSEGPHRLVVMTGEGVQLWDPEEGRLLHDGINRGCQSSNHHLLESAEGRHLLVLTVCDHQHPRHRDDLNSERTFLDVLDMGEAPPRSEHLRPAHRHG
jgi:WD40 repeat protein